MGLESDKVIGAERARDFAMLGDRDQSLGGTDRDMQKKSDRVLDPVFAQLKCQREQVVVVNPDDVGRFDERSEMRSELLVHRDVARIISRFELREIETVMKDGPQN